MTRNPADEGIMRYSGLVITSPALSKRGGYTETVGIIDISKFNPPRPEKQSAEQSEECLARIAIDIYANNGEQQSRGAHEKGCQVEGCFAERMLHHNHQGMSQRHGEEHDKKSGNAGKNGFFGHVLLFFHHKEM